MTGSYIYNANVMLRVTGLIVLAYLLGSTSAEVRIDAGKRRRGIYQNGGPWWGGSICIYVYIYIYIFQYCRGQILRT